MNTDDNEYALAVIVIDDWEEYVDELINELIYDDLNTDPVDIGCKISDRFTLPMLLVWAAEPENVPYLDGAVDAARESDVDDDDAVVTDYESFVRHAMSLRVFQMAREQLTEGTTDGTPD